MKIRNWVVNHIGRDGGADGGEPVQQGRLCTEEAMVVEVGPNSAFAVNTVGLAGAPFPLSFAVHPAGDSWMVDATAAQAAELADLFLHTIDDTIVVVDLDTNSFLDEQYRQWPLARIAAAQGVGHETHRLDGLASGVVGLSKEALVIRRDDLIPFFTGWSPYNLVWVDAPGAPTPEYIDEIALAIGTMNHDEPVLPEIAGSRMRFSGHDDCYITVESTDSTVPQAILGRLLALLVGSALVDVSPVDVPDPDGVVAETLIRHSSRWVGRLGAVSKASVTVDLSAAAERWRLGAPLPERVDRTVTYDVDHRIWHISAR